MKILKSTLLVVLCCLLALSSLAACHPKDEIALTVGDVKITSALYMAALIQADSEAKTKVSEQLGDNASSESEPDYYSQTIDGKKFEDYVKERAIEICKEFAAYEILKKDGKYNISDNDLSQADSSAEYMWSYGYSQIYTDNGVSLNTYKKYMRYSAMAEAYFDSLYGKGGQYEVDETTIKKTLTEKYELVNRLDSYYNDEMTDTQKAELKSKFQDYEKRLKAGTPFETIYKEHNQITDDENSTSSSTTSSENEIDMSEDTGSSASSSTSSGSTSSGEKPLEPKDKYASVVGDKDTNNADDNFSAIKKMKVGEVKIFELKDNAGLSLIVRKDISADPYYLESLKDSILHLLKDDDFKKHMKDYVSKLDVKVNAYATNRFKVKKIKYPSYS